VLRILSTNWPQDFAVTGLNRLGIDYEAVSRLSDIHAEIGSRLEYDLFVS